MNKHFKPNMVI